jgi:hypothetical protein
MYCKWGERRFEHLCCEHQEIPFDLKIIGSARKKHSQGNISVSYREINHPHYGTPVKNEEIIYEYKTMEISIKDKLFLFI